MKKTTLTFLFLLGVNVFAQPQTQSGVYSLSGSMSFVSSSNDYLLMSNKWTSYILSPSITYFVFDQVEFIASPSYTRYTRETNDPYIGSFTSTSTTVGAMIGVRYYLPSNTLIPFLGAAGGLSWLKFSGSIAYGSFSQPMKTYMFEAGLDYVLYEFLAVEGSIQYVDFKTDISIDKSIYAKIGIKYFIL